MCEIPFSEGQKEEFFLSENYLAAREDNGM